MHLLEVDEDKLLVNVVSENGYLFSWILTGFNEEKKQFNSTTLTYSNRIFNGSIEGLNVRKSSDGTIMGVCCSSDCTFNLLKFDIEQRDSGRILELN